MTARLALGCVLAIGSAACSRPAAQDAPAPGAAPARAPGVITAQPQPLALAAGDGMLAGDVALADYPRKFSDEKSIVFVHAFPPGLSPAARAGLTVATDDKLVSGVIDGDDARGYTLIYDENANGDLRDDPRHPLVRTRDGYEIVVSTTEIDPDSHAGFVRLTRFRRRGGALWDQNQMVRAGTLTIGAHTRAFELRSTGRFDAFYADVAIDLDGDGQLAPADPAAPDSPDSPELFHLFEKSVAIDGRGYGLTVDPDGDRLTLTPQAAVPPARPSLRTGTIAPDFAAVDLDGAPVRLSALRGKTVLLDFWAAFCGPCVRALPQLAALYRRRHADGFELVAIADSTREAVLAKLATATRAGTEIIDPGPIGASYRIFEYPTYFVVDPNGIIVRSRCSLEEAIAYLDAQRHAAPDRRQ